VTRPPTPTHTPSPTPFVRFYADPNLVPLCGCTRVYWDVENARAVYFQERGVVGHNSEAVCIDRLGTTTYELRVVYRDGNSQTFTADVSSTLAEPGTSLRESMRQMIGYYECLEDPYYCSYYEPDEVHILYPGLDPYRCIGEQAIPRIIKEDAQYTEPTVQEIPVGELGNVLITWLQAGAVPPVVVLVYPATTIESLGDVIDAWPDYQWLYGWDQASDAVELLQYRTPPPR